MSGLNFENLSPREQRKQEIGNIPRTEFVRGEVPFGYHYEFPGGGMLEAFQDEDGLGNIILKNEGRVVFDANDLLPDGFKFVTPTYFEKFPEEETLMDYVGTSWCTDGERKLILLGEFESPKDLLTLLHEIGHATNDSEDDLRAQRKLSEEFDSAKKENDTEKVHQVLLSEDEAKLINKSERRAWAWGLHQLRKLKRDTDVDVTSLFPTFQDIKKYINTNLATYRRGYEWIIRDGHDESFYKELQTYFDKWRYGRPYDSKSTTSIQ